jgi:hypothetical protein
VTVHGFKVQRLWIERKPVMPLKKSQCLLHRFLRKTPIRSISTEKARSSYVDFCRPGDEKDKGERNPK